jgi:RNA polymerase-associated protein
MVQNARSRTALTLYTSADDIHCHRTRLVLAAKGVAYDRIILRADQPTPDLLELNPYGTLPTLVDRDLTVYDPLIVVEFLDERYPHPPLMPIDPLSRARLRLATWRIENDWLPEIEAIQEGGSGAAAARRRLREHLLFSVELFKASRFFLNPEMSLIDCLVAPIVWRLPSLGVDLGPAGKPIVDYGERLFHSQGFARSLTQEERDMRPHFDFAPAG